MGQVRCEQAVDIYAYDRADQNREVGGQFENAVGCRNVGIFKNLREDSVLRRREESAVRRGEEQHEKQERNAMEIESDGGQRHRDDLGRLGPDQHAMLREAVGDISSDRREQQKRNRIERGRDTGIADLARLAAHHGKHEQDQRNLECVVVGGAEELRGEECQKSRRRRSNLDGHGRRRRGIARWRHLSAGL